MNVKVKSQSDEDESQSRIGMEVFQWQPRP